MDISDFWKNLIIRNFLVSLLNGVFGKFTAPLSYAKLNFDLKFKI